MKSPNRNSIQERFEHACMPDATIYGAPNSLYFINITERFMSCNGNIEEQ